MTFPECLKDLDQSVFLFLNGLHCSFLDPVMYWSTNTTLWLPLYLIILYLLIRKYRWNTVWIILFIILMIVISDQVSNIVKGFFARPRPTHEPGLSGVYTVNGYVGGAFGFYSAHASNTMAVAVFLSIFLGKFFRYFPPLIILWSLFMAYTRLYLGVHYPFDLIVGMLVGCLLGWGMARLTLVIIKGRSPQAGQFSE